MTFKVKPLAASLALALFTGGAVAADSVEAQLKAQQELIQKQAEAIETLQRQVQENQAAVEAAVEAVEADSGKSALDKLSIGGYGELHYNNTDAKKEIDFHRFVMFFGYEFSDNIRFFSEVELEHSLSGEGKDGEVELEQAYIDWDLSDNLTSRSGLFLLPIGLLNETHEPDTFYGVERNNVEKYILPTTWWEAGTGLIGRLDNGITVQGFIHSGLESSDGYIRGGRQKVSEAAAENLAGTLAINWSGVPGLTLGASVNYQDDLSQMSGDGIGSAMLLEGHMDYSVGNFRLRGLYAQWDIDGNVASENGADDQKGWYIEPSFKLTEQVGVFARYSDYEFFKGSMKDEKQTDVGVNYWIHPQVVFKADYQWAEKTDGSDNNGFNLGVGYSF
ncbi:porin [Ferrimonas aestuarii]|uniref:Porin n=1 Tax=Ferrimonas aestuarii TaxID=2569539 RepID=A0A4U1BQX8_9GAMM|nr:porin [Ferrimonas aestuarii]TKB56585.1 porin [Ferrimonas aestuarii]